MSHIDELDEFEAELELQLKKEYTTVFPLFRYCVLTQDATYLCNTLDLQANPQPNYPFFHLKMEDVWVWDKNRPSRIIPRAEVFTSSDVTVEELRGEGEEPRLTAEALAERIGETLGSDDDTYGLLLAVDVGNTQTVFGLFEGERLTEQWRVGTDPSHTGDELAVLLRAFVDLGRSRGSFSARPCPSSSMSTEPSPSAGPGQRCSCSAPVFHGNVVRYDDPREVGPDRIANAIAARERHGAPAIVVDFGTSTNFDVVSAAGEFAGGVLAPGIEVSMDALFSRAARLPKVIR